VRHVIGILEGVVETPLRSLNGIAKLGQTGNLEIGWAIRASVIRNYAADAQVRHLGLVDGDDRQGSPPVVRDTSFIHYVGGEHVGVADNDVGKSEIAAGAESRNVAATESKGVGEKLLLGEDRNKDAVVFRKLMINFAKVLIAVQLVAWRREQCVTAGGLRNQGQQFLRLRCTELIDQSSFGVGKDGR